MNQVAVFVDAGYLIAESARLLTGRQQPREAVRLDVDAAIDAIRDHALALQGAGRLLRIYWYDGLSRGGQSTLEQQRIAQSSDVKARFGRINMRGEQKGVDSLIVTDLIDLARDHAITDAVIIAGDEDLRVGLEKAQSHGVRVHLLGIFPIADNQSVSLLNEADSSAEWTARDIEQWLQTATVRHYPAPALGIDELLADVVSEQIATLTPEEVRLVLDHMATNIGSLPRWLDAPSLAILGKRAARPLSDDERKKFRSELRRAVEAMAQSSTHGS